MNKAFLFIGGCVAGMIFSVLMLFAISHQNQLAFGQSGGVQGTSDGSFIMGTGGVGNQIYDLCWVLHREKDNTHLALYRVAQGSAVQGTDGFQLKLIAARQIDWDLKMTSYNCVPDVEALYKLWKIQDEKQKEIERRGGR